MIGAFCAGWSYPAEITLDFGVINNVWSIFVIGFVEYRKREYTALAECVNPGAIFANSTCIAPERVYASLITNCERPELSKILSKTEKANQIDTLPQVLV